MANLVTEVSECKEGLKALSTYMEKENLPLTFSLPIKTAEELEELEGQLRKCSERFIKEFKPHKPVEGKYASTGLAAIISDDLLINYNFKGTKKQRSFEALGLSKILEAAWSESLGNDYQKVIKDQIKAAHNRKWVAFSREKKAQSGNLE